MKSTPSFPSLPLHPLIRASRPQPSVRPSFLQSSAHPSAQPVLAIHLSSFTHPLSNAAASLPRPPPLRPPIHLSPPLSHCLFTHPPTCLPTLHHPLPHHLLVHLSAQPLSREPTSRLYPPSSVPACPSFQPTLNGPCVSGPIPGELPRAVLRNCHVPGKSPLLHPLPEGSGPFQPPSRLQR